jgi:hypothetical protein
MGWFIMNKYYELTDIVFAYATALLLDPSKRAAYIRQDWPEEWRQKAYDSAHKIWAEEYRDLNTRTSRSGFNEYRDLSTISD